MFIANILINNEKADYAANNKFFSYLSVAFKFLFCLFWYNNNDII